MAWASRWTSLCRNLLRRERVNADLDEEVASYFATLVERRQAQGLPVEEARRAVRLEFGSGQQVKETVRDVRMGATFDTTFQDVRYALRSLRKSPAFALTAILSLALAIGANTAIYSIVDAALLRPLPVAEPDRLFALSTLQIQIPGQDRPAQDYSFSYPLYQQFRAAAGDSARLGLFSNGNLTDIQIPNRGAPMEKAVCGFISGDAFDILHVQPVLGRVFTTAEDRVPWGHPYAVISYDYWQRRFQGDRGVLGRHIQYGRHNLTIVGVARKGFFGVEPGKFVDIWIPAMMYSKAALTDSGWGWFRILGRLSTGATRAAVRARLAPVFDAYEQELVRRFPMTPEPMQKQYRERPLLIHAAATGASNFQVDFGRPLWIVLGVGAGILLIACANIASLLLARSSVRSAEMAMRISLGASRARLIRQLLTESLTASAIAGVLGWALAQAAAPVLVAMLSDRANPVRFALSMDTRVLLFCAAVSAAAAAIFGVLPAWQASAAKPLRELHGLRTEARKLRLGRAFVGVQVAFAFLLIVGGASFLFSLRNLLAVDTGFNPHNVVVINVSTQLNDITQKPELNVFLDELQRRVEGRPGIQGAAVGHAGGLFEGSHTSMEVIVPGRPRPDRQEYTMPASPRYFATMQLRLLAGREFEQRDRDYQYSGPPARIVNDAPAEKYFGNEDPAMGPRPVIVNQAFVQKYYGDENPLGKVFVTTNGGRREIIGVVGNAPYGSLREGPQPIVYFVVRGTNFVALYIRTKMDTGSVVRLVERETEAMGHNTRIRGGTTLDTLIGNTLLREKLLAGIGGTFALLGLMLAAIGLFGLLNYSVTRRRKEIGIRAALGARASSLVLLVLRDLAWLIAGGLAAGLGCSLVLMSVVRSLLFGVGAVDPAVLITAAAVFFAATLIAGGLPAGRAAAIDPMVALREE
ncbi:MAG TPA: ABC transporter permease [Bryobacteraceae bacterium]|nr:ABC transporter permease [Bryobacteraceae bacterium]